MATKEQVLKLIEHADVTPQLTDKQVIFLLQVTVAAEETMPDSEVMQIMSVLGGWYCKQNKAQFLRVFGFEEAGGC
jgi:hypothetical protein